MRKVRCLDCIGALAAVDRMIVAVRRHSTPSVGASRFHRAGIRSRSRALSALHEAVGLVGGTPRGSQLIIVQVPFALLHRRPFQARGWIGRDCIAVIGCPPKECLGDLREGKLGAVATRAARSGNARRSLLVMLAIGRFPNASISVSSLRST